MRKLLSALVVSVCLPVLAGSAFGFERYHVVVPKDNKTFTVDQTSYVRLHGSGDAKSTIEAEVLSGPARIVTVNDVFPREGGEAVTNRVIKEFNLKSTGKGMVKVKVTVTPGKKDATPKATTYEYEVK